MKSVTGGTRTAQLTIFSTDALLLGFFLMVWKAKIKFCLPDHFSIEFDIGLSENLSLNTFSPFCPHLFDSLKHSFLDIFIPRYAL